MVKVMTVKMARMTAEAIMTGRNLPRGPIFFRPSMTEPAIGSMKASKIFVKAKMPATAAAGMVQTSIQYFVKYAWPKSNMKPLPKSPKP